VSDLPERIRERLGPLEPSQLEVRDDGALHVGHAGAGSGGHFTLTIVSTRFEGASRVARHRMVYEALGPLMREGIHALAINARTPGESGR
jgi:BolA protein